MMNGCIKPGRLYIVKNSTVQLIRWLDLDARVVLLVDPTATVLEGALSTRWPTRVQVIALYTTKVKSNRKVQDIPPGYALNIAPRTTGFLLELVKGDVPRSLTDNQTIFDLDLSKFKVADLPQIKQLNPGPQLVDLYKQQPTSLYRLLSGVLGYSTTPEYVQQEGLWQTYTEALCSLQGLKSLWLYMTKAEAMVLFASNRYNYLTGLTRHPNSACSLAVMLQPFALKFMQTQQVEYLHCFARWVFAARAWAVADSRKLGVMLLSSVQDGFSKRYVYCSFDSRSLAQWASLVKSIRVD